MAPRGREGGGNSTKFYAGRVRPKVQPLTLIYILSKGRPRAGEELKKVFYGEAPPKGPAPYLTLIYILSKGRPQAGKELKKVFYGEDPPKVLPLTFIYTISDRKGYPFRIPY